VGNKLTTILDLDGSKFGRGIKQAIDQVKLADGTLNKLKAGWAGAMAAFAASPAAITGLVVSAGLVAKKSIDAASNLQESINAVTVSYGTQAEAVHRLGRVSADSFGLSRRAFNEFATTFEMFSQKIAASSGRSQADVLLDITRRISDIASLKNLDPAEATRTVMSGLAGETEAWRRIGGDVSAVTVEMKALEMQLADTASELTQDDKILARFALIMQQTDQYAGDFKNTQDQLANQQRTLAANTEDLAAAFGSHLIPVVADAAQTVNNLLDTYDSLKDRANEITGGGGGGGGGGGLVGKWVTATVAPWVFGVKTGLEAAVKTTQEVEEAVNEALQSWPLGKFEPPITFGDREVVDTLTADTKRFADAEREAIGAMDDGNKSRRAKTRAEWGVKAAADAATAATEAQTAADEKAAEAAEKRADGLKRLLDHLHDYERAQFDTANAQESLSDAQEELNRLQTEGTVSASEKASADERVTDAQESQADAASDLADAQGDLADVVASSIPTDKEKADSLRSVEDAARNLEDAIRGVGRAQRNLTRSDRNLTDLQKELRELNAPPVSENFKKTTAYKNAQADAEKAEKRSDLLFSIEDAELSVADAQLGVADANRAVQDATLKLNDAQVEHNRLMTVGHDVSDAYRSAAERVRDAEERWRDSINDTREAQQERDDLLAGSIATAEELEDATRLVKEEELRLTTTIEDSATAFANQKGAIDGSTTALALQRQEIERFIALNPTLATMFQPYTDLLSALGAGAVFSQIPVGAREGGDTYNVTLQVAQAISPAEAADLAREYARFNPF
jgi:hypothetical protein